MRNRGPVNSGRFGLLNEMQRISAGIEEDLQKPLAQSVRWYRYAADSTRIDPVYDVGDYDGGRTWQDPIEVGVLRASIEQGPQYHNDRGFYTVDTLYLVLNYQEAKRRLSDVLKAPDSSLLDRIEFRGSLFVPTLINPRALLFGRVATIIVQATQVKPEELVNDPQFNWLSDASRFNTGPFSPEFSAEFAEWEYSYDGTDVTKTANKPTPVVDYPTPSEYPEPTPSVYDVD